MRTFESLTACGLALLMLAPQPSIYGQAAAPKKTKLELTIDNIMRGPGLVGYEPQGVRWSQDASKLYFQWKRYSDPIEAPLDTYQIERNGSGLKKLSDEEVKSVPPLAGNSSKDKLWTVYEENGDLFLYDHAKGQPRQLTKTADVESRPRFLQDQRRVSFVRGGNLFVMSLDVPLVTQMSDIRTAGSAPAVTAVAGRGARAAAPVSGTDQQKGTDSQEFLKKQESDLLDVIRDRAKRREELDAKRKKENPRKPFLLTARQTLGTLELSPDEKYVVATVNEIAEGAKTTIVPNYVTESTYTEQIPSRTNVGDTESRARIVLIDTTTGETMWVDHGLTKIVPVKDGGKASAPVERSVQLSVPLWNEDGSKAVLLARAADNKDRWILSLDPTTGKTKVVVTMHDDAWVGGPGVFTLGWMKSGNGIYYQSERDGYSHLYTVSLSGDEPRQLTRGAFEVTGVQLSRDKSTFYLTTSEVSPAEFHFYSMPVEGGTRTKLTSTPGRHGVTLSPDDKWMADIYSYVNQPPELFVSENKQGSAAVKLTDSPAPEFWTYSWLDVPIVEIPASDGAKVPGKLFKPTNFKKGGPAVIFVHGAGYAQNVHRGWSANYYREYLFHNFLVEHGYAVLDLDYRASSGYGRDWRTAIYRFMGGKDLEDQLDGAKWLVATQGVDANRIGIYGGSYGGFITLMAMFTKPGTFAAGAALRPVTDWAHYNHGYTSNILNQPQQDARAYQQSSPIYHAAGLRGALLICHGMVDVNVHFQDSVRLVQKLIELRKQNWETAIYPVEDHGFIQPSSWTDEYTRIFKLFELNLKK